MFSKKQKAIFLDRDGTITKYKDFIVDPSQIELEEGAAKGIKMLGDAGFLVIITTNQPQVARGMCTEADIERINRRTVELLEKEGARIDAVYFCPHHPERDHPDIPPHVMKYRVDCECRKPKAGMLKTAAEELDIDLAESFSIGDRTVDIEAGKRAGCGTILVHTGEAGKDGKYPAQADYEAENLEDAAKIILMQGVKALILAGGRGERLKPLTDTMPKPMIEIAGKPLLEHQIISLRKSGIRDIIICGSYLIEKIKDYFGAGERFGVRIEYPQEPEQLGTGGTIKNAREFLKKANRIVIVNGDKMIGPEFDFFEIFEFDAQKNGFCTILVRETDHPIDSDVVLLDDNSKVIKFVGRGQSVQTISNSGLFIVKPELLDYIPEGKSNIEKDVIFTLINTKDIYGFMSPKHWFIRDIGTPERLESTRKRFSVD